MLMLYGNRPLHGIAFQAEGFSFWHFMFPHVTEPDGTDNFTMANVRNVKAHCNYNLKLAITMYMVHAWYRETPFERAPFWECTPILPAFCSEIVGRLSSWIEYLLSAQPCFTCILQSNYRYLFKKNFTVHCFTHSRNSHTPPLHSHGHHSTPHSRDVPKPIPSLSGSRPDSRHRDHSPASLHDRRPSWPK